MVGAWEEGPESETSLGICLECNAKANGAGMMVIGWNLRACFGSMHCCTARLLSYRSGTQVCAVTSHVCSWREMTTVAPDILSRWTKSYSVLPHRSDFPLGYHHTADKWSRFYLLAGNMKVCKHIIPTVGMHDASWSMNCMMCSGVWSAWCLLSCLLQQWWEYGVPAYLLIYYIHGGRVCAWIPSCLL